MLIAKVRGANRAAPLKSRSAARGHDLKSQSRKAMSSFRDLETSVAVMRKELRQNAGSGNRIECSRRRRDTVRCSCGKR
jgi:hypothetical protein